MKFHIFHDWSEWFEVKIIKTYAETTSCEETELPIKQNMLVKKICNKCRLPKYKKVRVG